MIAEKFFFPGDSFYDPKRPVDVLWRCRWQAPWMKLSEALDYAKAVMPRIAFPVHDALYRPEFANTFNAFMGATYLNPAGISFIPLAAGETKEL